jgi:hypothetical protein
MSLRLYQLIALAAVVGCATVVPPKPGSGRTGNALSAEEINSVRIGIRRRSVGRRRQRAQKHRGVRGWRFALLQRHRSGREVRHPRGHERRHRSLHEESIPALIRVRAASLCSTW